MALLKIHGNNVIIYNIMILWGNKGFRQGGGNSGNDSGLIPKVIKFLRRSRPPPPQQQEGRRIAVEKTFNTVKRISLISFSAVASVNFLHHFLLYDLLVRLSRFFSFEI